VNETPDPEHALIQLAEKIEELTALCLRLSQENQQLKDQQATLLAEQTHCLSRTRSAREKVESMLNRLQSLNQQS